MKDEKRVEWEDVTGECKVVSGASDKFGVWAGLVLPGEITVSFNRYLHFNSLDLPSDYRVVRKINNHRIERRVEVEQPKEVLIHTTIIGGDDIVHQRRISYQSAKELGLI